MLIYFYYKTIGASTDFIFKYNLKYNLFCESKAEFSALLLQFSVSHVPAQE